MRFFAFLFLLASATAQIPGDFKLSDLPSRCGYSVKLPDGWILEEFHGEVCSISIVPADLEKRGIEKFSMESMRHSISVGDCFYEKPDFMCGFQREQMMHRKNFAPGYRGLSRGGEMGKGSMACGNDKPLPKHKPCWRRYFWFKKEGMLLGIGDKVPEAVVTEFLKTFAFVDPPRK